jgi:hypothetical protein
MKGMPEARRAILNAKNQLEIYNIVESFCIDHGYRFADDCDLLENAEFALLQGKPGVAELLRFADIKEGKL